MNFAATIIQAMAARDTPKLETRIQAADNSQGTAREASQPKVSSRFIQMQQECFAWMERMDIDPSVERLLRVVAGALLVREGIIRAYNLDWIYVRHPPDVSAWESGEVAVVEHARVGLFLCRAENAEKFLSELDKAPDDNSADRVLGYLNADPDNGKVITVVWELHISGVSQAMSMLLWEDIIPVEDFRNIGHVLQKLEQMQKVLRGCGLSVSARLQTD